LDLIHLVNEGALDFDKDAVGKTMDQARQWALESLRTDAQFLFTPPQIALSCIYHYNKEIIREFLIIKFPPGRVLSPVANKNLDDPKPVVVQVDAAEKLLQTVIACDVLITERLAIIHGRSKDDTVKLVTGIDKKLWRCRKHLDSVEPSETAKRKNFSPVDDRDLKKPKAE